MDLLRRELTAHEGLIGFLAQAAQEAEPVLLIVNDSHRATLTREALIVIGEMVRRTSMSVRFEILVACGTHEFELVEQQLVERALLNGVDIEIEHMEWHRARAVDRLQRIGTFQFNRRLAERRFLLPIGSVEPHYFAGVTGPHKTLTIGCMGFEDIRTNHRGALDPASDILRLTGNPIHDGVVAAVEALKGDGREICCIGEVASGASLVQVGVGEPLTVVNGLFQAAIETFVHTIEEPFDLLHLVVPQPLGRSLYQADKAIKNNHRAVRDGGGIILEAECPEGIGASSFMNLLRKAPTLSTAREIIAREGYALGDHKAVKLRELTDPQGRGVRVALVTGGIGIDDARAAGMALFTSVSAARQWLETATDQPIRREAMIEDAGFVTVAPRIS